MTLAYMQLNHCTLFFFSVGKSSFLKMRSTPVLEVATTKRLKSAPRSTTTKRKVLMDDTMVLHGEYVLPNRLSFFCMP